MSRSLLCHAWGLRGYRLACPSLEECCIGFGIEQNEACLRCAHCGSTRAQKAGRSSGDSTRCPSAATCGGWRPATGRELMENGLTVKVGASPRML